MGEVIAFKCRHEDGFVTEHMVEGRGGGCVAIRVTMT